MKTFVSHSLDETKEIAKGWLATLRGGESAKVVGLSGTLGAGKTAFTQSLAGILGIEESVTSPTFVIMKIYPTKHPIFARMIHIDAYRLEEGRELASLGFEDIVADQRNMVVIEWPENVKEILPTDTETIRFEVISDTERSLTFEKSFEPISDIKV